MTSYLVDTNVVSETIRAAPSPMVDAFLRHETDLWLSVVALHELTYGVTHVADPARHLKLTAWIATLTNRFRGRIINVDEAIAEMAGRLRAYASSRGRTLEPLDSLMAATAMVNSYTLLTRNIRDFEYLNMPLRNPWTI